jgi:hypothetical protein
MNILRKRSAKLIKTPSQKVLSLRSTHFQNAYTDQPLCLLPGKYRTPKHLVNSQAQTTATTVAFEHPRPSLKTKSDLDEVASFRVEESEHELTKSVVELLTPTIDHLITTKL